MSQADRIPSAARSAVISLGGTVIAILLVGGVGGWAATTELSGAVIAPASVVVDTNVKKVQHPTGGVVGELLVRDGQRVSAGDIVLRLDETVTRANLAIVLKGLDEMTARQRPARWPSATGPRRCLSGRVLALARTIPTSRAIIDGERKLFELRRERAARPEVAAQGARSPSSAKRSRVTSRCRKRQGARRST